MMLEKVELLWRSRQLLQGQHSGDGRDRVAHGKEHALVNPRAYNRDARALQMTRKVQGVLNAHVTPFNFGIGELEKRSNGAFD
jgi:hypothetical protein